MTTTTYELKSDVTGEKPEKRGIYTLIDKEGMEIKLLYAPKEKCKKCYGRGYIGTNVKTNKFIICHKCYPKI